MLEKDNFYTPPWSERYSSKEMLETFSNNRKYLLWRELWIALAESQKELGLAISQEQIEDLKKNKETIDYEKIHQYEKDLQHDVMSHIKAFGDVAPKARGIIHMGVTSAFVTDNTDLIQIRDALLIIEKKLLDLILHLSKFAEQYKSLVTLGYTHFQAAQLTTVGKRATLWAQGFLMDLYSIRGFIQKIPFRGIKGAIGTGSGLTHLFEGNYERFKTLNEKVAKHFGFLEIIAVSGQTYDRKIDSQVAECLGQIAQSAHKMTNDLRLLQHLKEIQEGFGDHQVGSSAMAYKKNPILSERVASLAKFVLSLSSSPALVSSTQWLERTLDDSANKRLCLPQIFLASDAILDLLKEIMRSLKVYPLVIEKHVAQELPFLATESLLMEACKKGFDRQKMHEIIRKHSIKEQERSAETTSTYKNNLLNILGEDPEFPLLIEEIASMTNPDNYIGFAVEQTDDFLKNILQPILNKAL